jgi:hypothetical protein
MTSCVREGRGLLQRAVEELLGRLERFGCRLIEGIAALEVGLVRIGTHRSAREALVDRDGYTRRTAM